MDKLYVMLMNNKRKLNSEIIKKHVEHLQLIDQSGNLYLCGPFSDYSGGIEVLVAGSFEEATRIAESDPFIAEGYKTFELRTLEVANKDNNYLI
ncbi:YciI family protein [Clostridium sp. KNHs216]|uniref:YciI family protein n=1 Tax=Clostridium sp. KNHs216 TaxID=1550235 RepID=UPI0011669237|nr:YciI family protein [Clostridium sp. KNHs216]TQI65403.1 uncharacterized protein YciI [Clostridium sp. KNHs216]